MCAPTAARRARNGTDAVLNAGNGTLAGGADAESDRQQKSVLTLLVR